MVSDKTEKKAMSKSAWCSWWALKVGLALVVFVVAGCRQDRTPPTAPAQPVVPARNGSAGFPDTPVGRAARAHFQAARAIGPGVDTAYQASLAQLRSYGADSVSVMLA